MQPELRSSVCAESPALAGEAPQKNRSGRKSTSSPRLTPHERETLIGAMREIIVGLTAKAESSPPKEREALESIRSKIARKIRTMKAAGATRRVGAA